jgi:DUF4097 and DUF4098 domain-containing protein YvlB
MSYNTAYVPNPNQNGPTLYPNVPNPSLNPVSNSAPKQMPIPVPVPVSNPTSTPPNSFPNLNMAQHPVPNASNVPMYGGYPPVYQPAYNRPASVSIQESGVTESLLTGSQVHYHHYYPVYHPKYHYYRAKRSRGYCCFWAICCSCYCALICTGLILGVMVSIYTASCLKPSVKDPVDYSHVADQIQQIQIKNELGDVTIQASESANVTIEVLRITTASNFLDDFVTQLDVTNGTMLLTVTIKHEDWMTELRGCKRADITVTIPFNFPGQIVLETANGGVGISKLIALDRLQASTTNSQIQVENVNVANTLTLTTSNDDIKLYTIKALSIVLSTTNSDITLDGVQCDTATARTTNDDIIIRQSQLNSSTLETTNSKIQISDLTASSLNAQTTNGAIQIDSIQLTSDSSNVVLQTSNDKISCPSITGYAGTFSAKTSNGDVEVNGPRVTFTTNTDNSKVGYVGNGKGSFTANTSNSDIQLTFN